MQIQEEKQGDVLIVKIDDHLDTATSTMFETKLMGLIDAGERRLLVDCGALEYVNSAGLKAQQLTPHEAKTLVTRMGKGSKIIMIGDLAQIDNPYVDAHTNGLVYTRNRLQGQPFMAHVNLFKGERSEMAEVAANLM